MHYLTDLKMVSRIQVFIVLFVICCFLSETHQDICEEQVETVVDCWLHFGDPPACNNGKSTLAMCAEDRFSKVDNCSESIHEDIGHMVESYSELELALCEDNDLRKEIVKRKPCWSVLRSCALNVLMADSPDVECSEVMELVQICGLLSHGCTEVYLPYIKAILSQSECKNYELEYTKNDPEASFVVVNTNASPIVRFTNLVTLLVTSFIALMCFWV